MITPTFYPGQQVICINDEFTILLAQNPNISVPVKDEVYTIRKNYQFLHDVGVTLQEISNEPVPGSKLEPNFSQSRFAALQPATTVAVEEEILQAA